MQRLDVSRSSAIGATVWRRWAPWKKTAPPALRSIGGILLLTLGLLLVGGCEDPDREIEVTLDASLVPHDGPKLNPTKLSPPTTPERLKGVRYLRVLTEESPSWVSWREVQAVGSWQGANTPPRNLALGASIAASSSEPDAPADLAADGDEVSAWNAGGFAPANLDLSFSASVDLTEIRLLVNQSPPGPTAHVVQVAATPDAWQTVHVFQETTSTGTWLVYAPGGEGPPQTAPNAPTPPGTDAPPDEPPAIPPGSVGKWRRHVLSLSADPGGVNPFQVLLNGTFVHSASGDTLSLPGYYDGGNTWRIGFMPTRVGQWSWSTSSTNAQLTGHEGFIDVVESGHPGRLARDPSHPDKWRYADGPLVVPIGVFVNAMLEDATTEQFTAMADFVADNNLSLLNFRLSENDGAFSDVNGLQMHLERWQRLEQRMEILTERGLGIDLMLYTDDSGKPSFGPQSAQEQLLIRYAVARLCGFPVVMFNTGIDLQEYRDQDWVNWYGDQIGTLNPYDHPVSSRYGGGSGNMVMQGQTYNSVGDRNSAIAGLLAAFAAGDGVPATNNDNFSEDLSDNINGHSPADIRRAAWKATIAGGVGIHVRHNALFCPAGITECDRYFHIAALHDELNSEGWLSHVNSFVQNHLGEIFGAMTPAPDLVNSSGGKFALADPGRNRILFFLMGTGDAWDGGDGGPVSLTLGNTSGSFHADWFDPRTGILTPIGALPGGETHTLPPPSGEDWLVLLRRL